MFYGKEFGNKVKELQISLKIIWIQNAKIKNNLIILFLYLF